jgi:hypothetical protein
MHGVCELKDACKEDVCAWLGTSFVRRFVCVRMRMRVRRMCAFRGLHVVLLRFRVWGLVI